jgi:hypothetical protein
MNDDYLWDGSGPADPDVQRLEQLLRPLAMQQPPPLALPAPARLSRVFWWSLPATVAATLALVAFAATIARGAAPTERGWRVASETGATALTPGDWVATDSQRSIRVSGDIGEIDIEPNARVRLLRAAPGDHRLRLERGTLHALIWAPPGQFIVETASSTAVDLGCAYTLSVDEDGAGLVEVTSGWVGFELRGRESFIPAGSMALTRPEVGPGVPYSTAVSQAFRAALVAIDFGGDAVAARAALDTVLAEATGDDVVSLWHLLARVDRSERDRVFERLATFVAPPPGVSREGVRAGRREQLDAWWDALGLGTASWWRTWKQPWNGNR